MKGSFADVNFLVCPNCKCELVIESKVMDVNGLEGEAYDDALDLLDGMEQFGHEERAAIIHRSPMIKENIAGSG